MYAAVSGSCRPGIGDAFMNLVGFYAANFSASSDPRVCNWTSPVATSLPDSGSRTCAALLPPHTPGEHKTAASGLYLVGNQVP